MKPINEMKITFLSRSANEGFARAAVAAFATQLDPTVDQLNDLRTAVSEAVTNAIVHAYPDRLGPVTLTVKLYETGQVQVQIRDRGVGIPNVEEAVCPLFTTGGEERSGLGFTIMESYCDRMRVRSTPGKGTTVTLSKYIVQRVKAR